MRARLSRLIGANASVGGLSVAALSDTRPALVAEAIGSVLHQLDQGSLHIDLTKLDGVDEVPDAQQALATGQGDTNYGTREAH